jgi:hypothetical protein
MRVWFRRVAATHASNFLCWGLILHGLSTPVDMLAGDSIQFSLAEARYINAFGEVWPEKA